MANSKDYDWAEEHGYEHRRCWCCGARWWTDSNDPCPRGCRLANDDEQQTESADIPVAPEDPEDDPRNEPMSDLGKLIFEQAKALHAVYMAGMKGGQS